jgi:hypothetical protein
MPGKVQQLTIRAVAKASALGAHQGLVRARLGLGRIQNLQVAGMNSDDRFHAEKKGASKEVA